MLKISRRAKVQINHRDLHKEMVLLVRCIPLFPGREDAFHELSTREIHPLPYFSLKILMEFLLLERRKIWISNTYLPNILNLQPRTMGNKRKYKEIESSGPNESPKRGEKRQKKRESKDSSHTAA